MEKLYVGGREDSSRTARCCLTTIALAFAVVAARTLLVRLSRVPFPPEATDGTLILSGLLLLGPGLAYMGRDMRLAAPLIVAGLVLMGGVSAGEASDLAFYFGRAYPMVDGDLAAVDRMLGFDWPSYAHWFAAHPRVSLLATDAYLSIFPQAPLLVLFLAAAGQVRRVCTFIVATHIAFLVTALITYRFPALGAYTFYGFTQADHPNVSFVFSDDMRESIRWLREGTFRTSVDGIVVGLVSFPSCHAVIAAGYVWMAWTTRLRWPVLGLNVAMMLATPVEGSHYLVDLLGGFGVAWASIGLAALLLSTGRTVPAERPRAADDGIDRLVPE